MGGDKRATRRVISWLVSEGSGFARADSASAGQNKSDLCDVRRLVQDEVAESVTEEALTKRSRGIGSLWTNAIKQIPPGEIGLV